MPLHDPASTAVEAYRRGFVPLPLVPATKRPAKIPSPGHEPTSWSDVTYSSEEDVRSTFTNVANQLGCDPSDLNVGVALGARSAGLVDIDVDHPRALSIASTILPHTAMRSGREGNPSSHFWYKVTDEDLGIRQFKLPNKAVVIEYRAAGGQTVLPESTHPDGDTYRWEDLPWGGKHGPTEISSKELMAAVRMVALLVTLADSWPAKGSRHGAYLALAGGLLRDVEADGVTPRIHPLWDVNIEGIITILSEITHDKDGARARVEETLHSTRRKLAKGAKVQGWPSLAEMIGADAVALVREHVEEIETLGEMPRNRRLPASDDSTPSQVPEDHSEAAQEPLPDRMRSFEAVPPEKRDAMLERVNSWQPVDIGLLMVQGLKRPVPELLMRSDGRGLFYRNRVNSLYGSSGSGKTWLALHLAVEMMRDKHRVLMIDFEDEPVSTLDRLRSLHANGEAMLTSGLFAYIAPEEPTAPLQTDRYGVPTTAPAVMAAQAMLNETLTKFDPDLVIVDGVTTLYGMHGLNVNDAVHTDTVGRWLRWLGRHNTRTTLLIDHTPKNAAAGSGPTGSQHKTSMVQGAALQVQSFVPPMKNQRGMAKLYIGKDRHGGVMEHALAGDPPIAADVYFDGTVEGRMTVSVDPADDQSVVVNATKTRSSDLKKGPGRPPVDREDDVQKVMRALKNMPDRQLGVSKSQLRMALPSLAEGALNGAVFAAVETGLLTSSGTGAGTRYHLPEDVS